MKNLELKDAVIIIDHDSDGVTRTKVLIQPLPTMLQLLRMAGLYSVWEDSRDHRVMIETDNGKPSALVLEEDISTHGSPFWKFSKALEIDPIRVEEYAFAREAIKVFKKHVRGLQENPDMEIQCGITTSYRIVSRINDGQMTTKILLNPINTMQGILNGFHLLSDGCGEQALFLHLMRIFENRLQEKSN